MQTKNFSISYGAKIQAMRDQGLEIDDAQARRIFQEVSPFHLENFGLPYWKQGRYQAGTDLSLLYENYHADRMVKNFLFDYLADMEVQLRNVLGYVLHEMAGPFGYLEEGYYKNHHYHETFVHDLENELHRANEPFVRAFRKDDQDSAPVPVYVALEVITLGTMSKLVSNLKRPQQKELARYYLLPSEEVLASFLKILTILRNTCAHHGRLSNRNFASGVQFLKADLARIQAEAFEEDFSLNPYGFFGGFLALLHLLPPGKSQGMLRQMEEVFSRHPHFAPAFLNFPKSWPKICYPILEEKEAHASPFGF